MFFTLYGQTKLFMMLFFLQIYLKNSCGSNEHHIYVLRQDLKLTAIYQAVCHPFPHSSPLGVIYQIDRLLEILSTVKKIVCGAMR